MGLFSKKSRRGTMPKDAESTATATATDGSATESSTVPKGPWDIADAPEGERVDLGALRIPQREDVAIALEMNKASKVVTGATLTYCDTAIQLNVFAAPKSETLWDSVRARLRTSISGQGGTTETREGEFGTELFARIPVAGANGVRTYRPMRFVAVDGPRWMLRAVISGAALSHQDIREEVEAIIRDVVVDRGRAPMAPKEVIALRAPDSVTQSGTGGTPPTSPGLDPFETGPVIAEVR